MIYFLATDSKYAFMSVFVLFQTFSIRRTGCYLLSISCNLSLFYPCDAIFSHIIDAVKNSIDSKQRP